jgi:hypothetical protein
MYDMYPASWRVVDDSERTARHGVHNVRRQRRTDHTEDNEAVQKAMNRRDNGGEPAQ